MQAVTRWILAHKKIVVAFWVVVTIVGMMSAGPASKALKQTFSVPNREGSETNLQIARTFHGGGNEAPLVPVVTLPRGKTVADPAVKGDLKAIAARIQRAVPGTRVASYATGGDRAFVSKDGRTTYALAYPPPSGQAFGDNPDAEKAARKALAGATVAGAPVHLTGLDALQDTAGGSGGGPGVLVEALLGGVGALVVLGFVFASLLALVPIVIAIVSIMTTFLLVYGLTAFTDVSPIVQFLVALIGLGVAIDYSLLIVVRWREERAHGHEGDEAIVRAMATAGRAVVFSGTTVAIGLLALVALPLPFLRSVGYGGMLIPLVSVLVSTTLLPVILAKLGSRLDWPHVRTDDRASRSWTRWGEFVVRRRWPAAIAGAIVLGLLLVAASNLQLGTANPDTIAKKGDAKDGLVALGDAGIGSGALQPIEVLVRGTDPKRVVAATSGLDGVHGATAPFGARGGAALVEVIPHDTGASDAGMATVDRVRQAAHGAGPDVRVGGITAENRDFVDAVYGNFPLMIALIG
ncbi:MAG: putative drug exporter of the superfamily, partial [Thermoleophilaceae bacterium]|nr:putative drug exporter of the superfamily [Thermoleophilaceae bacterium]